MSEAITMSRPDILDEDAAVVAEVVRSGRLALGPWTERFESSLAAYVGVRHAVATSSGTAALHLIVRGLGIGRGDEVLVPSFTFAASANAILFEDAVPVFVDVEAETFNLDPADVERKITPRTRAIMAVDVFGHPAEWDALSEIAERHDLKLIDDCCEALGAEYRGRRLGSLGSAGAFGFYPNKQITTGEGGMLVTDDEDLATLARSLRNQGRDEMGAWLEHPRLGYNYRLDEMSAALGQRQIERIDEILARRAAVAEAYSQALGEIDGLRLPVVRPHVRMSWFVYVALLPERIDRDRVMHSLADRGIPVRAYFSPLHLQPYLRGSSRSVARDLERTEALARRTLALPFHAALTPEQIGRVGGGLREVLDGL